MQSTTNTTRLVLDVGNCGYDHQTIQRMLETCFAVEVAKTDQLSDTVAYLEKQIPDLILVNRLLDFDHSDGLEIVRVLKNTPAFASIPLMLVTNYDEHQQTAVGLGALYGFGKKGLKEPATLERLSAVLGPVRSTSATTT